MQIQLLKRESLGFFFNSFKYYFVFKLKNASFICQKLNTMNFYRNKRFTRAINLKS